MCACNTRTCSAEKFTSSPLSLSLCLFLSFSLSLSLSLSFSLSVRRCNADHFITLLTYENFLPVIMLMMQQHTRLQSFDS